MALTLVGTFEGESTTGTTVVVSLTGTAADDVVYAFQHTAAGTGSAPSGYTLLDSENDGSLSTFYVSRKLLTGADASVTFPAGTNGYGNACVAVVFRGNDLTSQEDATTTVTAGVSNPPNSPSITTVTDGAIVITAFGGNSAFSSMVAPAGYTDQVDIFSNATTSDVTVGAAIKEIPTAGAENPGDWEDIFLGNFVGVTVAVRPLTAGDAGRLVAAGTGAASFAARWSAGAALAAAGVGAGAFLASGAGTGSLTAAGASTVVFAGSSTGGGTPELPGLVMRVRKTPVLFRGAS